MMKKSAYDTTACSGFLLKKTIDALNVAKNSGWLKLQVPGNILLLEGGASFADAVPAFAHPLVLDEQVVVDVRPFGKYDGHQGSFIVRNSIEYKLAVYRAELNALWITQSPTILRDISPLPMGVFASWISESVSRRFALDPREQLDFAILAAVFYASQFREEHGSAVDEREKLRLTNAISRAVRCSGEDVLTVLDKVDTVRDVIDLCARAEEVTGSIRLKELTAGLLFAILGGTWFGTNAKEMVAVATEHPPTWIAILLAAFSERSYKNSGITKLTERSAHRESGKEYVRAVLHLLSTFGNH